LSLYASLPALDAVLNGSSAVVASVGYAFIRRKNVAAHRACMITSLALSSLFLVSYLTYHARFGATRYLGTGPLRTLYFTILATHTPLAAIIVPMIGVVVYRAWKNQLDRHRRLARITLPLWLYVSVTGVVIYFMLLPYRQA
jgi:uncharacterized membrane protein YozB (DUF420 family)